MPKVSFPQKHKRTIDPETGEWYYTVAVDSETLTKLDTMIELLTDIKSLLDTPGI